MKRLIYQVYIPIRGKSNLYDLCVDSCAKYCKKYGIDHIVQSEPILRITPNLDRTNRNKNGLLKEAGNILVIFEKENAFDLFEKYDQICIVDADIYIRENAPNIFDELGDNDFCGVLERDLPLSPQHRGKIQGYSRDMFQNLKDVDWKWNDNGAAFYNMGMMLMNKSLHKYLNGETAKQFIERKEFRDFVDGIGLYRFSTDQVLLNYWLKKSGAKTKDLSWKWNALYKAVEGDKINGAHFIHFFLKDHLPEKGENIKSIKNILGI